MKNYSPLVSTIYESLQNSVPLNSVPDIYNDTAIVDEQFTLDFFTTDSAVQFYRNAAVTISVILIIGPVVGLAFHVTLFYGIALIIYYYQRVKQKLLTGQSKANVEETRKVIFWWWRLLLRVIYDHEYIFVGDKAKEPAVYVTLHAFFPVDTVFIWSSWTRIFTDRGIPAGATFPSSRSPNGISGTFYEIVNTYGWNRDELVEIIQNGTDVGILPGGAQETLWGNEYYTLHWKNRMGFARVAIKSKCSIVPGFTRNIQEAFRKPWYVEAFLQRKFVWSRVLPSIFSGLPVKLTSYFGNPIPYDENVSPEELAGKTKAALEKLIADNQPIPGSVLRALLERFCGRRVKPSDIENCDQESIEPLLTNVSLIK